MTGAVDTAKDVYKATKEASVGRTRLQCAVFNNSPSTPLFGGLLRESALQKRNPISH